MDIKAGQVWVDADGYKVKVEFVSWPSRSVYYRPADNSSVRRVLNVDAFNDFFKYVPQTCAPVGSEFAAYLSPPSCTKWAHHSETLSGAFKLLETIQGVTGTQHYQIFAKQGDMGVYLNGQLVLHRREDGMFRIANKGEGLTCEPSP